MAGGWLSRLIEERALRSSAREVEHFIDGLRRTRNRDVGFIVGVATVLRVNMEEHGVLPEDLFQREALAPSRELGLLQVRLNRLSRQFVKMRQQGDATAAMVWSYSLRCLNVPGLEPLGRAMWAELARGFPYVEEALAEGEARNGAPFDRQVWDGWRLVPPGLEPTD